MRCSSTKCDFLCDKDGTYCCETCKKNDVEGDKMNMLSDRLQSSLRRHVNNRILHSSHDSTCQKNLIQYKPSFRKSSLVVPHSIVPHASGRSYFYPNEIANIYNFPSMPQNPPNVVISVISFGGGLFGSVDKNGVLLNGDIQKYWASIGIPINKQPKVIIIPIDGARNVPNANDSGATFENTLDIQTIGGCYPSPNLTILLYISPNRISQFPNVLTRAITPITINSITYKPTVVSISWGASEIYFTSSQLTAINNIMFMATNSGINICVATGDFRSNNGVGDNSKNVDFPSSSPYCTAVGGTSLVCPTNIYSEAGTTEVAWSGTGGGISVKFPKPFYQEAITSNGRSTPDIASNSDPNTGVMYYVNGKYYIFGGTSVAAPTFAAFLAACGISKFVNPFLYTAPSNSFNDIIKGSNGAYKCTINYDNCTGRGSIDGTNLSTFFKSSLFISSLTLNVSDLSLLVNQITTLVPTIIPLYVNNTILVWSSTNTNVATISNTGIVSAISIGTCTITCSTTDGSNKSASVLVTVSNSIRVTDVTIIGNSNIKVDSISLLSANVTPSSASNKRVMWSSSNKSIVKISNTGLITGIKVGTSTINCTSVDGAIKTSLSVSVTR